MRTIRRRRRRRNKRLPQHPRHQPPPRPGTMPHNRQASRRRTKSSARRPIRPSGHGWVPRRCAKKSRSGGASEKPRRKQPKGFRAQASQRSRRATKAQAVWELSPWRRRNIHNPCRQSLLGGGTKRFIFSPLPCRFNVTRQRQTHPQVQFSIPVRATPC